MHQFSTKIDIQLLLEIKLIEAVSERVVQIARGLIEGCGSDIFYGEIQNAIFYIPTNEAGDEKYPSMSVNITNERFSDRYAWRVELTFMNQDAALSTQILVRVNGTIEVMDYAKNKVKILSLIQAESLLIYLDGIKDELVREIK